jgi:beta-ribofuranosylaminobenzene 5'-phosphate synthase
MTAFSEIDKKVGLSPVQKILLTTDGSVTRILEALGGEPVTVETVGQGVIRADNKIARTLDVPAGSEVNHRVVNLRNPGGVLLHAVSYAPLERLRPEFKAHIMRRDKPIGRIMAELGIEARREITGYGVMKADEELSKVFSIPLGALLLKRTYNIIYQGEVLLNITEIFPSTSFR